MESKKGGTNSPPSLINSPLSPLVYGQMPEAEIRTIRRAQAGDSEAFRELLMVYQKPVMATLYRFLGGRFSQEIEDYAQDVFIKLFKAIDRFDFGKQTKFSTWVFTFVKNYSIDVLKKKRLEAISLQGKSADEDRSAEIAGKRLPPPQELSQEELAKRIETAILELPEDQRQIIILREYQDMSYGEIAKVLNCSEGTVKSRMYRAREFLRQKLAPYLREETS